MNASLRIFINQLVSVVLAALAPVVLVTFLSIPYSLGAHPGEQPVSESASVKSMT